MKFDKMLDMAAKTFAGVKLGGKKSDPKLAELDRGVLGVAFLVAALDGTIEPAEYAAFDTMAKKCRGGSAKNIRKLLDATLSPAGQLMAMAQVTTYSEKERLEAFLKAAKETLPGGFVDGSMADVRRAFALWVTMGVADGEFSAIEKAAIHALEYHYAVVRAVQKEKKGEAKEFSLLEADFFGKVEKIIRDIGPVEKAEKLVALEKLIATVHDVDDKGGKTATPASSIAVRLVAMAMIGMAV